MESSDLQSLKDRLRRFAEDRDWDKFHSPKNLAMALIVEAGELVEHFQWLTEDQSKRISKDELDKIEQELADILLYLVRLADKLDISLYDAVNKKISMNQTRYPAEQVRGSSKKYTEYR